MPKEYLYTFEFRHKSWFCEALYELLNSHEMTLCFYNFKTYQSPEIVTGPFIYIRMHGPNKETYQGSYEERVLTECTQKFERWQQEGKTIYCYFDNDEKGFAPTDARRLKALIEHSKSI